MTEQDSVAYNLPHDKAEIYRIFESYDFRDRLGHKLTLVAEFIQLADFYCQNTSPTSTWEN